MIDVEAAVASLLQLCLRAKIGPSRVVELQIAATSMVGGTHRLLISDGEIFEDGVPGLVGAVLHRVRFEAKVHDTWRRNGHLWRDFRMRLEELEVINHRVVREADFADDAEGARLGLNTLELNSVIDFIDLDAVEHAEEIVMP